MILINSSPKNALKIFQPFLPINIPVGIGCLAAAADKRGVPVDLVDEQIEDDALGLIISLVRGKKPPYFFGFSVLTAALKSAVDLSLKLKQLYPDSIVCFGGIHPTASPEEVMAFSQVDFVLRGEGERSLFDLYDCLKKGGDVAQINNLSYRRDGKVIHNERLMVVEDLEALPPFPYHRFKSNRYDLGFVLSSRGCPYRCIFCSNRVTTGRNYRIRPAGVIADEIEMLYRDYGRRRIHFLDDNLLVSKERIYVLMDELKRRGLDRKVSFSFQARGDNVNPTLLKDLYESGFRSVFFGLETASEEIMKTIKKGETVAQCKDAVIMAKKAGFHVSATFIYALPGETHQDRMDCVRLSTELNLDMVRFNNATPYPGTELYAIASSENRLNIKGLYENFVSVSTFIENPFKKIPFSYVPAGNTEDQIRRDILFSYFNYYIDIRKLKEIFAKPELGVGWFNAGDRFMDMMRKLPALAFLSVMMFFKLLQLFYYCVIRPDTRISLKFFLRIFEGLGRRVAVNKDA